MKSPAYAIERTACKWEGVINLVVGAFPFEQGVEYLQQSALGVDQLGVPLSDGHGTNACYRGRPLCNAAYARQYTVVVLAQELGDVDRVSATLDCVFEVVWLKGRHRLDRLDERVSDGEVQSVVRTPEANLLRLDHFGREKEMAAQPATKQGQARVILST